MERVLCLTVVLAARTASRAIRVAEGEMAERPEMVVAGELYFFTT
jgi:hypothetical protein